MESMEYVKPMRNPLLGEFVGIFEIVSGGSSSKSKKWTCGKLRKLRTRGWETPELNEA